MKYPYKNGSKEDVIKLTSMNKSHFNKSLDYWWDVTM